MISVIALSEDLGRSQLQTKQGPQCEAKLNGEIRAVPLATSGSAPRRPPVADKFGVKPSGEITAPPKALFVLMPVQHAIFGAPKPEASLFIELVWHAFPANPLGRLC